MNTDNNDVRNYDSFALCLPTLNEEENVEFVVSGIRKVYSGLLFIVDGFSVDKTVEIAEQLNVPIFNRALKGKGSAIQKALEVAEQNGKEFLIYMDCDRSYSAADIAKMVENAYNVDLVIGVRPLSAIKSFYRKQGNVVATKLINSVFNGEFKDPISGFKCLRISQFKPLLKENGDVFEAIICLYASKYNMRTNMLSIDYYERVGTSKVKMLSGVTYLITFFKTVWKMKMSVSEN